MTIYISTPTQSCKSYCDKEFIESLKQFTYQDKEVHIFDNGTTLEYFEKLKVLTKDIPFVTVHHVDVTFTDRRFLIYDRITQTNNFSRELFLSNPKYTHFFSLESDVIAPPTVLEDLLVPEWDMSAGLYYEPFHPADWWLPEHSQMITTPPARHILGGCSLFTRKVMEATKFRYEIERPGSYPDGFFAEDARQAGFTQGYYTKVKCKHLSGGWTSPLVNE